MVEAVAQGTLRQAGDHQYDRVSPAEGVHAVDQKERGNFQVVVVVGQASVACRFRERHEARLYRNTDNSSSTTRSGRNERVQPGRERRWNSN